MVDGVLLYGILSAFMVSSFIVSYKTSLHEDKKQLPQNQMGLG